MVDISEPVWLSDEELDQWYAFAYVLTLLPAALESRMQRDADIAHFDYLTMSALSMAPERTLRMSELAQYTGSALSRLSNAVTRLERRGWVTRRPDPVDGRYNLATLTERGFAKVEQAAPAHVAEVRRLVLDPLTTAQRRQLSAISQRLLSTLEAPCPTWGNRPDANGPDVNDGNNSEPDLDSGAHG